MDLTVSEPQVIAYDEEVYSSFPDLIKLPNGELWCIYREGDVHHPTISKIILLKSNDDGIHWEKSVFKRASLEDDGYVFNCPRINYINSKLCIVSDTKSSQSEGEAEFKIGAWWSSKLGSDWSPYHDFRIRGIVPDKIVPIGKKLVLGYHFGEKINMIVTGSGEKHRLVQMMAISHDQGETWRDRTTIAVSDQHSFCEGGLVDLAGDRAICYLRDNRSALLRSHFTISVDQGQTWCKPIRMNMQAHRIVAAVKKNEPFAGAVIGTYRDTIHRSIGLFIHNITNGKMQSFSIDNETHDSIFDYGYTGWVELDDGSLLVAYYIRRNNPNPEICLTKVKLK